MSPATARAVSVLSLAAVLLLCLASALGQSPNCHLCAVPACAAFSSDGLPLTFPVGFGTAAEATVVCETVTGRVDLIVGGAPNATCASTALNLTCEALRSIDQSEATCNASSIETGAPFGNATYFEQRCAAAQPCTALEVQDQLLEGKACSSLEAFLSTLQAQPAPSTVPCAPCNITACHSLATYGTGAPDVVFFAGSLPGIAGSGCAAQQAVAANLLANGLAGVSAADVGAAVCDPLAALSTVDSQAACAAGELDGLFDGFVFFEAAAANQTWEENCPPFLTSTFNPTTAGRLIASGYCVSPSAGLSAYTEQFVLSAAQTSVSSSSAANAQSSSSSSSAAAIASSSATSAVARTASPTAPISATAPPVLAPTSSATSSSRHVPVLASTGIAKPLPGGGGIVLTNAAATGVGQAGLVAAAALLAAALLL